MDVTISGDAEQFVREEVASGRYASPQEVIREGLRLLHEREARDRQQGKLNEQIQEGLAELERGEGIPGEQVFQGLWEKSQRRRAAR